MRINPTRSMKRFCFLLVLCALMASAPLRTPAQTSASVDQPAIEWRVTGPMGGDVRSIAIDPKNTQRLLIGTLDGQMYESTDGGTRWSQLTGFSQPSLFVEYIVIDPRDSNVIYVAAHRHKEPGGFFKSVDGGKTWRAAAELKSEALHAFTQSPSDPDVLLAGTNRGVFRSTDAGETWTQLGTADGLINIDSLAVDPRTTNTIYAGTWYLPYKTTDGGASWTRIKQGMIDDSDVFAIEIDQRQPDHVIASACSGIYESKNGGLQWKKVQGIPSTSRRTRDIVQHPARPSVVFAGTTEGLWRSVDGAASWTLITDKSLEVNAIAIHEENPDIVYIGTNNFGVMISRDGGKTFTTTNDGFSGRRAYTVVADRERAGRIYAATINTATGGGFFFVSNDSGRTWQTSMRGMAQRLIVYSILQDERAPDTIYIGTNAGVYRSADRGASWATLGTPAAKKPKGKRGKASAAKKPATQAAPARDLVKRGQEALNAAGYDVGTPDGAAGTRTITALRKFQTDKNVPVSGTFDSATLSALGVDGGSATSGTAESVRTAPVALTEIVNALAPTFDEKSGRSGLYAATNGGLFRTYDPASGWERIAYGKFDPRTLAVSVGRQNPMTVYVGTATSGALVTRDAGETWTQVEGVPATAPINVIEQDPKRASYVYVGSTQTFYVSRDGGSHWSRRGGGLPIGTYTSILINPNNPDEVFVGSAWERGGGVFRSADAGQTWQRIDARLPSGRVWALAFDTNNPNHLLVGSHSAGVYLASRDAGVTAATEAEVGTQVGAQPEGR